jgi:hypothetical protein
MAMKKRGYLIGALAAVLLAVGIIALPLLSDRPSVPAATWLDANGSPFATVGTAAGGESVTLRVRLPQPAHVYVASYSPAQGMLALFPSEYLRADSPAQNPLLAGEHSLPGRFGEAQLRWPVEAGTGSITYMLVVSRDPLPEVVDALAHSQQMGNAAFGDFTSFAPYMPSIGKEHLSGRGTLPTGALRAAFDLVEVPSGDAMIPWHEHDGVFLACLKLAVH